MSYLMVEPGSDLIANTYIHEYTGVFPDCVPTKDEVNRLEMGEVVKYHSTMLDFEAGSKISASIVKADANLKQTIAVFTYERTSKIGHGFPKDAPESTQNKAEWVYGSGFRIILNHTSAKASASVTLAAFAAEATLNISSCSLMVQTYGCSNIMPSIPSAISGFSKFDVETLGVLEQWIDSAKDSIGDGWINKSEEEKRYIIENTRPQLIGVSVAASEKNLFATLDELTLFCLWRFVYGDSLEKTLNHLKSSSGEASKRAREFPSIIHEDNLRSFYRSAFLKYGGLSKSEKEKVGEDAYLLKMPVPAALKKQSHDFIAVYRSAG